MKNKTTEMPCEHAYYGLCPHCLRDELSRYRAENDTASSNLRLQTELLADANAQLNAMRKERDESRRMLDDARAQEPVAYLHNKRVDVIHTSVKSLLSDFAVNSGPESMLRPIDKSERYTIPLYAAPVPAQPAVCHECGEPVEIINGERKHIPYRKQPAAVPLLVNEISDICNAYESGVGHRGRPTANVNPYREGTPEHEAYAIGAKGEAAQADDVVRDAVPASWIEAARKAKMITADVCRAYPETAAAHINGLANLLLAAKAKGE